MTSIDRLHYLDLDIPPQSEDLVAVLMKIVHGYNARHDNALGVDFPDWTGAHCATKVQKVRIFGQQAALEELARQVPYKRVAGLCGASLEPKMVPSNVEFVRLCRANKADRPRATYIRRLKERALARGEEFKVSGVRQTVRNQAADVPVLEISARSLSTGQVFNLKVNKKREEHAPASVVFNAYGLCKEGAVPSF